MMYTIILIIHLISSFVYPDTNRDTSIGKILIFRGTELDVFSAGSKVNLEEGMAPYKIYPGDEIKLGGNTKCEILLNDGGILTLTPETQVSMEWFSDNTISLSVRYGIAYYNGTNEIFFRSRGMISKSKGGDFIVKYNRAKLAVSIFNLNSTIDTKHIWNKKVYRLKPTYYLTITSYDDIKKTNKLDNTIIANVIKKLKVDYKPDGKVISDTVVPGRNPKITQLPYTQSANMDLVKRSIGI